MDLIPPTEFELITAQQLCLERNRDEPSEKDMRMPLRCRVSGI